MLVNITDSSADRITLPLSHSTLSNDSNLLFDRNLQLVLASTFLAVK
jgi:hypothetical protein